MSKVKEEEAEGELGEPESEGFDKIVAKAQAELLGAAYEGVEGAEVVTEEKADDKKAEPVERKINPLELVVPEDAEGVSGFFKGKPVAAVFKSHHEAELKIAEQGREISRLMAEAAAKDAAGSVLEKLLAKKEDPKITELPPLPDPIMEREAFASELAARNLKVMEERQAEKDREAAARDAAENVVIQNFTTAMGSVERARQRMPQMDDDKFNRVAKALINEIKESPGEYEEGLLGESSYVKAYKSLFGELPEQELEEEPAPVVQQRGNPPAFGQTAPRASKARQDVPSLRREQEDIVDRISSTILAAAGLSGEDFEAAKLDVMGDAARRLSQRRA